VAGARLAQGGDEVGTPVLVRGVGAGQADDRGFVGFMVGGDDVVDSLGGACRHGVDAAGREQVGRERGPGGVLGDASHRGKEDGSRRAIIAHLLERLAVTMHDGRTSVRAALGAFLVQVGELAQPGDGSRPVGNLLLALLDGFLAASGQAPVGDLGDDPAAVLALTEQSPCGAREVVGELLDRVRAAGRVGDDRDVRLADEQAGDVAGDAPAERLREAERLVEREHRDGLGTTSTGSKRGDRGADHVHVRVVGRHHRPGRDRVLSLATRIGGDTAQLGDAVPEASGRAQLRDGDELLVGGRIPEVDLTGCLVDGETGIDQQPKIGHSGGK
jgi:hypothetical protein